MIQPRVFGLLLVLVLCWASPAGAQEPVRVAAIFSVTGTAAAQNMLSLRGLNHALAEINHRGGVLGRPLSLEVLDNRSTAIGAKVAAERAVDLGVTAIVGANWSSHSLAIAPIAQMRGIPMITPISTHPSVTRIGDHIFRVCYTDDYQGHIMARFAHFDLKARRAVSIIDISDDYSLGLSLEFAASFERLGGEMAADVHYKHTQPDFAHIAKADRIMDADVCFIPGHDESGRIALLLNRMGASCTPLGGDGWGSGRFYPLGGDAIETGYYCTHWHEKKTDPKSRAYVDRYGGTVIDPVEVLSYDALMLLADAIERAESQRPAAVRDAIAATSDFPGVTGSISFDEHGDPLAKGAVILRIENGRVSYLKSYLP
jgi:branched-chain amino acid transport system substrate-binding protein